MQLHQSILGHSRSSITAMNVGYGTVFTGSSTGRSFLAASSHLYLERTGPRNYLLEGLCVLSVCLQYAEIHIGDSDTC